MATALDLFDDLIEFLESTTKGNQKCKSRVGCISLTSENLSKVFCRSPYCEINIVQMDFVIGACIFTDKKPLGEYISESINNLMLQKVQFSGATLLAVEECIDTLELIVAGQRPEFQLTFLDFSGESYFEGQYQILSESAEEANENEISEAVQLIETAQNIVILNGAGLSVSAGIPDFRSSKGLYNQINFNDYEMDDDLLQQLQQNPQLIFYMNTFLRNPVMFYKIYKQFLETDVKPTFSHWFQSKLWTEGKVRKIYTQNIDGLLRATHVDPTHIIEVHGTAATYSCYLCKSPHSREYWQQQNETETYPIQCLHCAAGLVRPNIVFFGEPINPRYKNESDTDGNACDLLIITGTSLKVAPVKYLVQKVSSQCPRLLVNRDRVGMDLGLFLQQGRTDLFYGGNCDDNYVKIAKELGWYDEIKQFQDS